ncbi:hypothetical protein [Aneurinibacillus migulanus]|uniref:hypothetical protein n=1 Tax=Aneurinibacillus migulanus TaxID=47500 RepID=UPI000AC7A296
MITERPLAVEYMDRRAGAPPVLVAERGRIKSVLGWEPQYSDLETILSSAWHWHRTHPNGYDQ